MKSRRQEENTCNPAARRDEHSSYNILPPPPASLARLKKPNISSPRAMHVAQPHMVQTRKIGREQTHPARITRCSLTPPWASRYIPDTPAHAARWLPLVSPTVSRSPPFPLEASREPISISKQTTTPEATQVDSMTADARSPSYPAYITAVHNPTWWVHHSHHTGRPGSGQHAETAKETCTPPSGDRSSAGNLTLKTSKK